MITRLDSLGFWDLEAPQSEVSACQSVQWLRIHHLMSRVSFSTKYNVYYGPVVPVVHESIVNILSLILCLSSKFEETFRYFVVLRMNLVTRPSEFEKLGIVGFFNSYKAVVCQFFTTFMISTPNFDATNSHLSHDMWHIFVNSEVEFRKKRSKKKWFKAKLSLNNVAISKEITDVVVELE